MKKLITILLFICSFSYGQTFELININIRENTHLEYNFGLYHVWDTLFLNGHALILDEGNIYARFESIVGPGDLYIYKGARIFVRENLPPDVQIWVIISKEYETPEIPKQNKG